MLKDIILASALTLSQPPLPHFYDINNVYNRFVLNLYDFDYQHYNSYVLNLNDGTSFIGNTYRYENNVYQITNTTMWTEHELLDFHNYLSWVYTNSNKDLDFDTFSLELDFNGWINNFVGSDDEIVIPCSFMISSGDNDTYIDVSGTQELRLSSRDGYAYIYADDWLDAYSWLTADNSYLVLNVDNMEGDNGGNVEFSGATYFTSYTSVYIGDDTIGYLYGSYEDFIYQNVNNWVEYGEDLRYEYNYLLREANELLEANEDLLLEKSELIEENEKLERINQDLILKNDQLNSKYAFNGIFDLLSNGLNAVNNFLSFEIAPNINVGMVIFIPIVVGVVLFILKVLVL